MSNTNAQVVDMVLDAINNMDIDGNIDRACLYKKIICLIEDEKVTALGWCYAEALADEQDGISVRHKHVPDMLDRFLRETQ